MVIDKHRGFTLIELLVVIAIIAVLMSILMPALKLVKNQAQSARCKSNLKQWSLIFALYTDENNGYFNEGWGYSQHPRNQGPTTYGLWMNALRPYYKDSWRLLLCPSATREVESDNDRGTFKAARRTIPNRYPAPGEGSTKKFVFSYSINSWTNYMNGDRGTRWKEWFWKNVNNNTSVKPGTRISTGKKVSRNNIPVFGDNTWHDAWPRHQDSAPPDPEAAGWGTQWVC